MIKKHHDLLEQECHKIDLAIAIDKAKQPGKLSGELFERYVAHMKEKAKLETKLARLESNIEDLEENCSLATLMKEGTVIKKMISKKCCVTEQLDALCKKANLKRSSGPVAANLDTVLQAHNIQRQKYHGKSFVGNDCNRYLQKEVYKNLCSSIVAKTEELTQSPDIRSKALSVKTKFIALFKLYSIVHRQISHTRPINEEELSDIRVYIDEYLAYYRGIFPYVRIIIKQHLLEDHVVPMDKEVGLWYGATW